MPTVIDTDLDWSNFDWQYFQTLSIELAKSVVPTCSFLEYLKPGQKQDGIDLLGFMGSEGKFICVQCKKEKTLTSGEIKNIIGEFKLGQFYKNCSHFIIITSADLQNRKIQSEISLLKIELKNNSNLEFHCLDKSNIETLLRTKWHLVAYYFGEEHATRFCYPQTKYKSLQNIIPVNDYIPRKVTLYSKSGTEEDHFFTYTQRKFLDIKGIIVEDRLKTNRFCLIADAYQGKSYYLKNLAFELSQIENIQPLFIEVKNYNIQAFETLLDTKYGAWKAIPLKDIILIIDGVDEAPTEKFVEVIKQINEFGLKYNPVSIIFSCRKLFFNKYDVSSKLETFDVLELWGLDSDDITWYLNSKAITRPNDLIDAAYNSGIGSLLYHPFYLIHIVEEYRLPPYKLPDNKIKVIDGLIERSLKNSMSRQTKGSDSIKDESFNFKKTIEKFAFGLQLAGTNSLSNSEIQQLFDSDEKLLLQHNSLVIHLNENWSFANALFQEHIAASLLSKMNFEQIVSICTVGKSIKKIKTKWIQTVSSLLSILEYDGELFQKVFSLIEEDNIELAFQTENSKYENKLKLILLQKLIEKSIKQNIRTLIVSEESIGIFIYSSIECTSYLLDCLENNKLTNRVKIVCLRILKTSQINIDAQKRFNDFVTKYLPLTQDSYYASNIIRVLVAHKLGDKNLIDFLTGLRNLNEKHEFRDYVYELIIELDFVDDFYTYGIHGLPYLLDHNKGIRHSGSQNNLEDFILSAKSYHNISILLSSFKNEGWMDYCDNYGRYQRNFLKELFEKLVKVFDTFPSIIFPIAIFLKDLGRMYRREDFKEVDHFLEKTNTHWLMIRILIDDIFNDENWELGALITYESYDYILFTYEEGKHDLQKLKNCFVGLRYQHEIERSDTFRQMCDDATEGLIFNRDWNSQYLLYQQAEKLKRENDLRYIQTVELFRKGVVNYFEAYGKKSIPEEDLYLDIDDGISKVRQQSDSYFIFKYLTSWHRNSKKVNLSQCLKELDKSENFETFRAEEILGYHYQDEESEKVLLPILENYYQENLATANFKNCLRKEGDEYHWLRREFRLGQIFRKYKFHTEEKYLLEMVWLDDGGTRSFQSAKINNTHSISELILEQLSESGKNEFRKRIVQNINSGIKLESVLGNHIGLCKHLKITDATDIILQCIKASTNDFAFKTDSVDIYLELGGKEDEILKLYKNVVKYNDYFFFYLTSKLYKIFNQEVISIALKAMNSTETDKKRKIEISQILAEMGVMQAFKFLVNEVKKNKKSPYNIQSGHPICKLDTRLALIELEKVIQFVVDPRYIQEKSFHDSAKNIILEWCNSLASKSESDMELVINFLEKARDNLKNKFTDATDINWYINRILEDFRTSDETVKSVYEIKLLLSKIEEVS